MMAKHKLLESRRLAISGTTNQAPVMTSFDDSLLLVRQPKLNFRNSRLGMFQRSEIVTSIDENSVDSCPEGNCLR